MSLLHLKQPENPVLLAASFLSPLNALFATVWTTAYLIQTVVSELIGPAIAVGACLSLVLIVGIGGAGVRWHPFHSATAVTAVQAILLLALRLWLPFSPGLAAIGLFAVALSMTFGNVAGLYGTIDAVAPVVIREDAYWRLTSIVLFGFFVGALGGLLGLTGLSMTNAVVVTFILSVVTSVLFAIEAGRPVVWAPEMGRQPIFSERRSGDLTVLRERGSLVLIAAIVSFLTWGLLSQMHLLVLQLLANTLGLPFSQWLALFAVLFAVAGIVALLVFSTARSWLRWVGAVTLFPIYPSLMVIPLIYWAVMPTQIAAALLTTVFYSAFIPSLYLTATRFTVSMFPLGNARGVLLLTNGLAGSGGLLIGALSWFLLQPFMSFSGLVRTTAALDLLLIVLSVTLALTYRWHWLDRLRKPGWGLDLTRNWPVGSTQPAEIEELLADRNPFANALGLNVASQVVDPERYFPLVEAMMVRQPFERHRDCKLHAYLAHISLETLEVLRHSSESQIRFHALAAAVFYNIPVTIDELSALLRDEDLGVRLLACIAGWEYGLEAMANVAWQAFPMPLMQEEALRGVLDAIPDQVPVQVLGVVRQMAHFPSAILRAEATQRLATMIKRSGVIDADIWELAVRGMQADAAAVRCAAANLFAVSDHPSAPEKLAVLLMDPCAKVATAAGKGLATKGEQGVAFAVKAMASGSQLARRASIHTLMRAGKAGEEPFSAYLKTSYDELARALALAGTAVRGDDRWLPVRAGLQNAYGDLLRQYAEMAHVRGFPSIGFALQALAAYGPLWSEAATGILAHWLAPGPYRARAVRLTRIRQDSLNGVQELGEEEIQRSLSQMVNASARWLVIGGLLTHYALYKTIPKVRVHSDPMVRETLEQVRRNLDNQEPIQMHRVLFLKTVPLFSGFTLDDLYLINQRLVEERFPAGSEIFRQGTPGTRLYIVLQGSIELTISLGENVKPLLVRTIKAGEHMGDVSLLEEAPRLVTATAMEETVLLSMGREQFVFLITERPETLFPLTNILEKRLGTYLNEIARLRGAQSPPT